ncbi:MAG: hypothetical protein QM765_42920 [Myxococcales bacterium]
MLRRLGVQTGPLRALLVAFLRMDLRNQAYGAATGVKTSELLPPVYWVVGQFLATSMLLGLALFARVDAAFFAFAHLSCTALLLFSAMVVEFHEVAFDPADAEVLGHRPVSAATYSLARLVNLLAYVGLMTCATSLFPAILGCALRDGSAAFAPAFVLASALTALCTAALVVLLYTVLGAGRFLDEARTLLSWVQIGAILVVFYAAQLMLRDADGGVEHYAARPPEWLANLPTMPLARAVAAVVDGRWSAAGGTFALAALVTVALSAAAAHRLAAAWAGVHAGTAPDAESEERLATGGELGARGRWTRLTRSRQEAASLWLTWTMLRRDSELKLRSWPALSMALAALVLGALTGQLANPMIGGGTTTVLTFAVPVLLAGAVPSLFQNAMFSRDAEAGRLLALAPLPSGADLARGVRKALLWALMAPATLVAFAAFAVVWRDPLDALVHSVVTWLMIEHAARLAQVMVLEGLPFSRTITRGATLGSVAAVSALASAAASGIAALQYLLAGNLLGPAVLALALSLLLVPASRWADRASERMLRQGARLG